MATVEERHNQSWRRKMLFRALLKLLKIYQISVGVDVSIHQVPVSR